MKIRCSWRGALGGLALSLATVTAHAFVMPPRGEIVPLPADQLIPRLEIAGRSQWQQPELVVESLGVQPGDRVADVGAGSGFFTFVLADKVGREGKVYAVEIDDDLLGYIGKKQRERGVTNVVLVKSSERDPHLPPASCDRIMLVDTYNYIADPVGFMSNLRKALAAEGTIAIIDGDTAKLGTEANLASSRKVIDDMARAGFRLVRSHDFLERQFFLVFEAQPR